MIRINLATGSAAKPQQQMFFDGEVNYTPAELQKQGLLRLVILAVIPLALWYYETQTIPKIIAKRDELTSALDSHRSFNAKAARAVQEIKRVKEDEAKLQTRIASLQKLSKDRFREIKVLDLIQQQIPEKVWLNKIDANNGRMTLSGMAMSDFDISGFMESLSKSVYFVEVTLLSSAEQQFDGLNLRRFEILCVMERPST